MKGWCLLLAPWLCGNAAAQSLTNNGASISLQPGAQLTVQGALLNNGNGTIANSGTIDVTGDWTNNAATDCFGNSEGTVVLNGSGQSIQGTMYTQFFHLQLAGGDVTLQQNAYCGGSSATSRAGVIALNDAHLFLNGHVLSTSNPSTTAITRTNGMLVSETAPPANYGRFTWWLGNAGPGNYVVPFGSTATGNYLPVSMNVTAASTDPLFAITFATYPTNTFASPNNRPLPSGLAALTDQAGLENATNVVDRFWPIGTGETSDLPTASLTFTYRDSEWNTGNNTIAEATLRAQRFDGAQWSPPNGVANTITNVVTTTSVSAFDQVWTLSAAATPLPVELLFFDARPEGSNVLCTWSTASEQNNDFFTVERSRDGEHFENIGEVDGAGSTQQTLAYSFTDEAPYDGLSYYRLRQTDFDGTQNVSQVVAVLLSGGENPPLIVWPNPAQDLVMWSGGVADSRAELYDPIGHLVLTRSNTNILEGLSVLARGVYTLRIRTEGEQRTAQVVLE